MPVWGQAEGQGPRAEGRRRIGADMKPGGRGEPQAERESDSIVFWASLLGFVELGL